MDTVMTENLRELARFWDGVASHQFTPQSGNYARHYCEVCGVFRLDHAEAKKRARELRREASR